MIRLISNSVGCGLCSTHHHHHHQSRNFSLPNSSSHIHIQSKPYLCRYSATFCNWIYTSCFTKMNNIFSFPLSRTVQHWQVLNDTLSDPPGHQNKKTESMTQCGTMWAHLETSTFHPHDENPSTGLS